ncbi:MAG TPA: PQQ-binding-like beta-propeller repeat protein [Gemmata sp.]|nr:PQQ-binding-like beta-propeller repeat protein [Gemmata sp.]
MRPVLVAAVLATAPVFAVASDTWPQWRGPTRDGVFTGRAWPDQLTEDSLVKVWRADDLGPSYSGPVVSADSVFTTATMDKKVEVVTAFDRATGKERWKAQWDGSLTVPFFAARNGSWVRATPALDGDTLYVAGIRDLLVALDTRTGKERWRLDFVKEYGTPPPDFGFVCSPLVGPDGVYVQAGGGLAKVDKATGKVLWRSLTDGGGMMGSAFSSPVFAKLDGRDQLVVQTRTKLAGVDPADGRVLWSRAVPSFRGMNILTPQPVGPDGVFTSTYEGTTQVIRVKAQTDGFAARDGWAVKYEGHMTSPVVVKGHAYLLGRDRRLACFDLAGGKEAWRTDERFSDYWSLIANGDKLLGLDSRGTLVMVRADPREYRPLGKAKLAAAEAWAHLAAAGDELYVRDLTCLTAYRWAR